jgi:hypothetical protein
MQAAIAAPGFDFLRNLWQIHVLLGSHLGVHPAGITVAVSVGKFSERQVRLND